MQDSLHNRTYSQCGEDVIMLFLAQHVLRLDNVYYLDLGANDESHFNNTRLFYDHGYRGVSVDANKYFEKAYKANRPDDTFVACGVGEQDGKADFYEIDPHTLSTFSQKEAEAYTKNGSHKIVSKKKRPIYTPASIISKFCAESPNMLSLDVEGMDLAILNTIDFTTWRPAIVCVETLGYTQDALEQKNTEIIRYLESKGYRLYADTYINSIFVEENAWSSRT